MEGRTIAHIDPQWKIINFKSEMFVAIVVARVTIETSLRGDADAASGGRALTGSGDGEQDIPDWLKPFTEGLVAGESGSSGSAGATTSKTPPSQIPARPQNKRTQTSRELHAEGMLKVEKKIYHKQQHSADHKVLNEVKESSLNHRYAAVVKDLAFHWIQSCPYRNKTAQDTMSSFQRLLRQEKSSLELLPMIRYSLEFTKKLRICVVVS